MTISRLIAPVALLRICNFEQTPDTYFLREYFFMVRVCLREMLDYYVQILHSYLHSCTSQRFGIHVQQFAKSIM